jgi:cytochrome c553
MGHRLSITMGFAVTAVAILSVFSTARAFGDGREDRTSSVPSFSREIEPVLAANCLKCHGATMQKADLDLRSPTTMEKGGVSGPAIERGASSKSLMYEQISKRIMPPGKAAKLSDEQIRLIARWIDAGAPADVVASVPSRLSAETHWAFRPPVKAAIPSVKGRTAVSSAIDSFILGRLEAKGSALSQRAASRTLIRRATFDLTGLPPTPEEIDGFLADTGPDAYNRLIDRLLASPAYGERWGRHWLDNAGYADTHGGDNDLGTIKENKDIWKYRDYVVRSLNADKPFDCFITEQLAGDEQVAWRNEARYTSETIDKLVATGFLRNVPDDTNEAELNRPLERNEIVGRVTESVASNLLGLTFNCARCHNHKYDPVTQEEYYKLVACFTPVYDPGKWKLPAERCLPDVPLGEAKAAALQNAAIDRSIELEQKKGAAVRNQAEEHARSSRYALLPEALRGDLRAALAVASEKRTEIQKYLAEKLGPLVEVTAADVERALSTADKAILKTVAEKSAALAAGKRAHGSFQAVWEEGAAPSATRILRRGEWTAPLAVVEPGFPAALCQTGQTVVARPIETKGNSSGRRLALARWLTSPDHPLVARVVVNRIWQHHFGTGIVATPDNFGLKGAPPSHPELLDWLAVDLIEHGWRLKRLHRLIMTSSVYLQSSTRAGLNGSSRAEVLDPGNELLGRMSLRRLEAEALRDAVLAVSGRLERRIGGAPTPLVSRADGLVLVATNDPVAANRRSLYLFARRNYPVGLLDVFDFPIMALNCTRRPTTATPLQSLAALNSEFVQDQAVAFAERVRSESGLSAGLAVSVERAFLLGFGRPPLPAELRLCVQSFERQAEEYRSLKVPDKQAEDRALQGLCHMLMCSNEFLYIE